MKNAVKAIRAGKCYGAIFRTAIAESSVETVIRLIEKSKDPFWSFLFARDIKNLNHDQRKELRKIYEVV